MKSRRKLILFVSAVIGLLFTSSFILFLVLDAGHVGFAADAAPSLDDGGEHKYTVTTTIWNDTRQDVFITVNTHITSGSFSIQAPYPVGLVQKGETKECSFELDLQQLFEKQYDEEHGLTGHGPYTEDSINAILEKSDVLTALLLDTDYSEFTYSITVRDQNNQIIEP